MNKISSAKLSDKHSLQYAQSLYRGQYGWHNSGPRGGTVGSPPNSGASNGGQNDGVYWQNEVNLSPMHGNRTLVANQVANHSNQAELNSVPLPSTGSSANYGWHGSAGGNLRQSNNGHGYAPQTAQGHSPYGTNHRPSGDQNGYGGEPGYQINNGASGYFDGNSTRNATTSDPAYSNDVGQVRGYDYGTSGHNYGNYQASPYSGAAPQQYQARPQAPSLPGGGEYVTGGANAYRDATEQPYLQNNGPAPGTGYYPRPAYGQHDGTYGGHAPSYQEIHPGNAYSYNASEQRRYGQAINNANKEYYRSQDIPNEPSLEINMDTFIGEFLDNSRRIGLRHQIDSRPSRASGVAKDSAVFCMNIKRLCFSAVWDKGRDNISTLAMVATGDGTQQSADESIGSVKAFIATITPGLSDENISILLSKMGILSGADIGNTFIIKPNGRRVRYEYTRSNKVGLVLIASSM